MAWQKSASEVRRNKRLPRRELERRTGVKIRFQVLQEQNKKKVTRLQENQVKPLFDKQSLFCSATRPSDSGIVRAEIGGETQVENLTG